MLKARKVSLLLHKQRVWSSAAPAEVLPFDWTLLGFSVDACETPDVSARSLVSTGGRSVRKSQTCRRSYLLLAGSSQAYLLLAGSSVKLIFIGWLLLRTACEPCRAAVEVEGAGDTARMTGTSTDSSITSVGKIHTLFPPSEPRQKELLQSLVSLLPLSSPSYFLPWPLF